MEEKTVTITLSEYEQLLEDSKMLNCLEMAGVDNWDGYEYAMGEMGYELDEIDEEDMDFFESYQDELDELEKLEDEDEH